MKQIYKESGITLLALIITIIILVIAASVSISALNQDEGILNQAFDTSEDYIKGNYEQQIYQILEEVISEKDVSGQEFSLLDVAQKLNNQDWVKTAVADEDIIITSKNGQVFQVYFNEQYGQRFVEYLGKEDENEIPSVSIEYTSETQNISVGSDLARRIQLLYNGEIITTSNSTSLNYTVENTGWYTAKVISNSGKVRYAWIRVSIPNIGINLTVTSGGARNNGWYGKDNVPVQVTISTDASEIYYKLGTAENFTHIENNSTTISINTVGKTKVYAYAVDSNSRQSEISSIVIKFDNTKPKIGAISSAGKVKRTNSTEFDIEISLSNMSDTGSGIEGYSYWLLNGNLSDEVFVAGDKPIKVSSSGEKRLAFQARDKAGNLSDIKTLTVEKSQVLPGERASKKSYYVSDGKVAVIPEGFVVSNKEGESSIASGLVIYRIPDDDTAGDGDNDLTDAELEAIDWTNSIVTEGLRTTYDQFVWIPVDTPYVTAAEITEIINTQNFTNDTTGENQLTANQKAINYLITKEKYPMAVQEDNGTDYRGILYNFTDNSGTVAISSYANFTRTSQYREPSYLTHSTDADGSSTNNPIINNETGEQEITQEKLQNEYNNRIEQAILNGGFWVGRYETSGMADSDASATIKVVAGVRPSRDENWYRMYAQEKAYIQGINNNYAGGMVSGAEWDQVMIYLITKAEKNVLVVNSVEHNKDNLSQKPYETGGTNYTAVVKDTATIKNYGDIWNNICDLEGNVREWTMEAYVNSRRVYRGGLYNSADSSARRGYGVPSSYANYLGSRVSLFVK